MYKSVSSFSRRLRPALLGGVLLAAASAGWAAPIFDPAQTLSPSLEPVPAGPSDPTESPAERLFDPSDIMSGVAYLSSDKARMRQSLAASSPVESGEAAPAPFTPPAEQYTMNATGDSNQDVEPSIRTLTIANTPHTTIASIKFLNTSDRCTPSCSPKYRFRNYYATTSSFFSWTRGQLPLPAAYSQSGDPMMDQNGTTNGIVPHRQYIAGIMFQDNNKAVPNAIGVWHSDDGGSTWSQPSTAALNSSQGYVLLDKPYINVSQWSGDLGEIFLVYMQVDDTGHQGATNSLFIVKSTDGGLKYSAPVLVAAGPNIEIPIVLTSPFGDMVYVLWVDYALRAIRMSTSTESLASWTAPETAATGSFVPAVGSSPDLNGGTGVRAGTIPMARYNAVTNSIGIVWHEFESPTSANTDIFFVAKDSAGWHAKTRINPSTTNDQFMPGLDYDSSGNYMVTYYDRAKDPGNRLYEESWVRIDHLGTAINSGSFAGYSSDPAAYYPNPNNVEIFIGDYQDSWWWRFSDQYGNRFNACWVYQPNSSSGDIHVTGIQ